MKCCGFSLGVEIRPPRGSCQLGTECLPITSGILRTGVVIGGEYLPRFSPTMGGVPIYDSSFRPPYDTLASLSHTSLTNPLQERAITTELPGAGRDHQALDTVF